MILYSFLFSVALINTVVCRINDGVEKLDNDEVVKHHIGDSRSAFDQSLYEVDDNLCQSQLDYISGHRLLLDFLDASSKLPSGIQRGNLNDLGDYYQCLSIHHIDEDSDIDIQGKYCSISIPLNQNIPKLPNIPDVPWPLPNQTLQSINEFSMIKSYALSISGIKSDIKVLNPTENRVFPSLAAIAGVGSFSVCVPKACSPRQAIKFYTSSIPLVNNITYSENYCRLPGDKPFSPADYIAMTIFGVIGILIIISTTYDLYQVFVIKQVPSKINLLYRSFSLYTNTQRFLTFKSTPGALECIDGIRSISMMWVVVGHSYSMVLLGYIHNFFDVLQWMQAFSSTWISAAPITVDTFFLLSGILVVYTSIGKISRIQFIKNIHLFIINRLLRMFPLLAAMILLQASVMNHVSDGPYWNNVALAAENCRTYWWSALLHVQNYVNPMDICLAQTWYLSVDMQLYMISPIVLVFLFGSQKVAWGSLTAFLLASLASSTAYSFSYNFSAALGNPARLISLRPYITKYYFNTICRASPFSVGMLYGYVIHQWRERNICLSKIQLTVLWIFSFGLMAFCIFTIYPVMQIDHDVQVFDNFLNAYMRAIWAVALGLLIFACVKGHGGPINWFLSLQMWKLIARLSYAMYLVHIPIIMVVNGSWTKTYYFTEGNNLYNFIAVMLLTFLAAFFLSVTIDAPFSTLQKILLGGGAKKRPGTSPEIIGSRVVEVLHPNGLKI